jgi:bifunctional non-homologous end joining protein LigD
MTDAATIAGVRFTHPDKEVFPAQHITKRAVAEYLQAVAPRMLAHVKRRLISLVRCPDGQGEPCFFQRHLVRGFPASVHQLADAKKSAAEAYIFIDDQEGLLGLAQMGVLELHIWGSHVETIETPDRMVFDLDPADDVPFAAVKDAAVQVRKVLDALGLESFAMLSGGKGVHVVVPLLPKREWADVKAFAGAIAARMAADRPDRFVATMTKAKRHGKVFIDFFRNDKTATAVAPYSTRAKAGAPLAWPVTWPGLARAKAANEVTIATWRPRLRGRDPWDGYHRVRQSPSAAAFRALGLKA